jgi:F-type H+-transporting ATPase subunit epsilon
VVWANDFKIRLFTPEKSCFEGEGVKSSIIPVGEGFMGILPNHANFIGRLGMGPAYIRQADKEKVFVIRGGWIHIQNNIVELAADEVIDKKPSTEELSTLKEAVDEIPTQTVEGVEEKRQEVAWLKHLERFGK